MHRASMDSEEKRRLLWKRVGPALAALIGARDSELFFTSGGTESDNSVLFGIASKFSSTNKRNLVISSVEHHAIFHAAESLNKNGFETTTLPVDSKGFVSPDQLDLGHHW